MSETHHRIIEHHNEWLDTFVSTVQSITNHVAEFSVDSWYWLENYVKSAPERKGAVLLASFLAVFLVAMLIRRTHFF